MKEKEAAEREAGGKIGKGKVEARELRFTLHSAPNANSEVRRFEMEVLDAEALRSSLGIRIQFVQDWQTYSLHEAILYLQGYEDRGELPRGTAASARRSAERIWG